MKYFADFVSFLALCMAFVMAFKHRLPWVFCAFLVTQGLFTLCGWWVGRNNHPSSREYLLFFATFVLPLIFAIGCSLYYPIDRWLAVRMVPALIVALYFCGKRIYEVLERSEPVKSQTTLTLECGGVMLFCGITTLLSLVEVLPPDLRKATICLGINWTLQGLFGWVLAATRGKLTVRGVDLNDFVPQFIAIICFAGLAVMLSGAQPESARQHARDEVAMTELQQMEAR